MRNVVIGTRIHLSSLKLVPLMPLLSMFADSLSNEEYSDSLDALPVGDTNIIGLSPTFMELVLPTAIEEVAFLRQAGKAIEHAVLLKQKSPLEAFAKQWRTLQRNENRWNEIQCAEKAQRLADVWDTRAFSDAIDLELQSLLYKYVSDFSQQESFLNTEQSSACVEYLLEVAKELFGFAGEADTEIVLKKLEDELQLRRLAKEDLQDLMSLFSYVTGLTAKHKSSVRMEDILESLEMANAPAQWLKSFKLEFSG